MKNTKIVLKGYNRFILDNQDRMEWNPTGEEHIILGTNGAGKSSLLSELLNLVPNHKDFNKGGYKIQHLTNRGHTYVLESRFATRNGGKFFFFKNGEQLNEGNTQATQKELVEREFGLTADVIDVLSGASPFSHMGNEERKRWMMKLSGTDFSFALDLHKQFKERERDFRGSLNRQAELLLENQKELARLAEDYERNESLAATYYQELQLLNQERSQVAGGRLTSAQADHRLSQHLNQLDRLTDEVMKLVHDRPDIQTAFNVPFLEQRIAVVVGDFSAAQERVKSLAEQIESLPALAGSLSGDQGESEADLRVRLDQLTTELTAAEQQIKVYQVELPDAEHLQRTAVQLMEPLSEVVLRLKPNSNGEFTRTRWDELQARREALLTHRQHLENHRGKLLAILDHANHVGEVDCPQCKAQFKPGVDVSKLDRHRAQVQECDDKLKQVAQELTALTTDLEVFGGYREALRDYRSLVNGYSQIADYWNRVAAAELLTASPRSLTTELNTFTQDATTWAQIQRLRKTQDELAFKLMALDAAGGTKAIAQRREELETRLYDAEQDVQRLRAALIEARRQHAQASRIEALRLSLLQTAQECVQYRDEYLELLRQDHLGEAIKGHYERMGLASHATSQYKNLAGMIASLEAQQQRDKAEQEAYKLITQALSPNEGVVAEAVKEFIGYFSGLLNEHISQVWTYDMRVQAELEDVASLNWKFPVYIQNTDPPVPDVKNCSEGQRSMINFAFKLVVIDRLGLEELPLLIDEFGRDFDNEHRARIITYVNSLMDRKLFSQMFMVSHYAEVYAAFHHAKFVVLDARNITTPAVYNDEVVFG